MPYFFKNINITKCIQYRIRSSDSSMQILADIPEKEPMLLTVLFWKRKTVLKLYLDKELKSTNMSFVIQSN